VSELANSIYLICPRCGWDSGDMRIWEHASAICGDCGCEVMTAYPRLADALAEQERIRIAADSQARPK
jgi:hypothetical protein